MTRYMVIETARYRVMAKDEEAAIKHVTDDAKRDKHCFEAIVDRFAYESPDATEWTVDER